jgi:hypothetical protein
MWLIFRRSPTNCYILEFDGTETIQDLRETLGREYNLSPGFVLGFGPYSLDNPSIRLNTVPDLHDLSEITLVEGTGLTFVPSSRIPAPMPAPRPPAPRPQATSVKDPRADLKLAVTAPPSTQTPAPPPVVTAQPSATPTVGPAQPSGHTCCAVA